MNSTATLHLRGGRTITAPLYLHGLRNLLANISTERWHTPAEIALADGTEVEVLAGDVLRIEIEVHR